MRENGVNVQRGDIATNGKDAMAIAKKLSNKGGLILKAQV
jgi:succinyl-CoA synthetase beta subunit